MEALLWLVAIVGGVVALSYAVGASVAGTRARSGAILAVGLGLIAAILVAGFLVRHPLALLAADILSVLAARRLLRVATRNRDHASEIVRVGATHMTLIAGTFLFVIPFAWLLSTSLKSDDEQAVFPPVWIPTQQVLVDAVTRPDGTPGRLSKTRDGAQVVEVEELPNGDIRIAPLLENGSVDLGAKRDVKRADLTKVRRVAPRWLNYVEALKYLPPETAYGWTFLRNTLILTLLSVLGTVLASSMVAYSFARLRWPGREVVFKVLLATMMIPGAVTLMPQFLIFRSLGWVDSLRPLWVPAFFGSAFNIFLLRQFFLGIPNELDDASKIDGCGPFGTYWRVMLPQVKPALAAIAIMALLAAWNNFQGPLIYLSSPEQMPMAYGLQLYQQDHGGEPGLMMAASTLVVLPIIVLFFFTQRYFIEGVSLSGLGGR
ncbi:MAG: carbohydrate ABC transporter permease [Armatimonadota bacterium]